MKKIFLIPTLAIGMFVLQACEKDDLPSPDGNKKVESTFNNMYTGASQIEWEKNGNYWVADFWKDSKEMEAWFDVSGNWHQTETDIVYSELPDAVKTGFSSGDYKDWFVDDVDMFEHKDSGTFYVLDVEKNNQDYDLYFSPNGTMTKAVRDKN